MLRSRKIILNWKVVFFKKCQGIKVGERKLIPMLSSSPQKEFLFLSSFIAINISNFLMANGGYTTVIKQPLKIEAQFSSFISKWILTNVLCF